MTDTLSKRFGGVTFEGAKQNDVSIEEAQRRQAENQKNSPSQLNRDPRYPSMDQNGTSGVHGGGGHKGPGHNGPGGGDGRNPKNDWLMGVEVTYGHFNGEPQKIESTVGTKGWIQMANSIKDNGRFSFDHKMTGHTDGNIHHHTRLSDDTVRDFLDKRSQGNPPSGNILGSIVKRGL